MECDYEEKKKKNKLKTFLFYKYFVKSRSVEWYRITKCY